MWLLDEITQRSLEVAFNRSKVTADQQVEYEARDRSDSIATVVGGAAEIPITGVLTQTPDFFMRYWGGGNTTYPEIISALAAAEADPAVDRIILAIDSPGGNISGLFEAVDAIAAVTKPVQAVIHGLGASAAYALASQAGEVIAANRASRVGSVGIAATFQVREDLVTVTSSKAPKKIPDVTTAKGKAVIVKSLDGIHKIFVDSIAEGRKISSATVNKDFGQGAVLLAAEALEAGMIDRVLGKVADTGSITKEGAKMDLKDLKAEHPAVYAEAVQVGIDQEQDRVGAHLTMGENFGAMAQAVKAVKDGSLMTQTATAEYLAAGQNKTELKDRKKDDEDSTAGDGATAPVVPDSGFEATMGELEKLTGSEEV